MMPYSAATIAFAFVKKGIEEGKAVTQMKLQKMVYFAQGYHLAKYSLPLIEEEFEAWKYGPVIPSIYQLYKLYGSEPIIDTSLITDLAFLERKLLSLDTKAIEAINYTWQVTKNLSASNLSAWTHKEGSPWYKAYTPALSSIKINNNNIKDYFSGVLTR